MKRISSIKKRWSMDQLITGIELPQWLSLLKTNDYQVDSTYAHRAAWVSALSLPTTALGRFEDARFGRTLAAMEIDPEPIFVLGHWRSGTTHLHNLLGRVPEHTYSTVYQVMMPGNFLTTGKLLPDLTSRLMDDTRTYDNVKQGWHEAAEDEIALAKLTGLSPYISFMFPDQAAKYEKYVDFIEATHEERERWKQALRYFIKKIMLATGGKRVIIKSCTHTARIRLLLEMFPNARFVFIHRHPYEVFLSTLHMRSHTDWENFFHRPEEVWEAQRHAQTLALGQRIFERYLADRRLIPEENLVELAYSDLVGHEMAVMEHLWDTLRIPNWDNAERVLQTYVDGLAGYQTNKLKRITKRDKGAVYEAWRPMFDAFGYDPEYSSPAPHPAVSSPSSELPAPADQESSS
ncbi:MAG: sulfotransferase [Oligoflexia bacterium]|nr:sulfotransferase [Oligoflexia bacterium]